MVSPEGSLPAPWYEGDHFQGGHSALNALERPTENVLFVSAGWDRKYRPQVLVLGLESVEVWLAESGESTVDAAYWQIRELKATPGQGISLGVISTPFRQDVLHRVRDEDATEVEQRWVNTVPISHHGVQVSPLNWREEKYAYLLGRVVREAAATEGLLGSVLAFLDDSRKGAGSNFRSPFYGESGRKLIKGLEERWIVDDEGEPERPSPLLLNWAEQYKVGWTHRNQLVHGTHIGGYEGGPLGRSFKPIRAGQQSLRNDLLPEEILERASYDAATLSQIVVGFEALKWEVQDFYVNVQCVRSRHELMSLLERTESSLHQHFPVEEFE